MNYAQQLVHIAQTCTSHQIASQLDHYIDISHDEFNEQALIALYRQLVSATGCNTLGLVFGQRIALSIPEAATSLLSLSEAPHQALAVLAGYARIIDPSLRVHAETINGGVRLLFAVDASCTLYSEAITGVVQRLVAEYFGDYRAAMYYEFPYQPPAHHEAYQQYLGQHIRFNRPCLAIEICGYHAITQTLAETLSDNIRQLKDQLTAIEQDESMGERVSRILATSPFSVLSRAAVANELGVSQRTLARRLASENTCYRKLVQLEHYTRATQLLKHTALTQTAIAAVLGYENCANFQRAYKQWANIAPMNERLAELNL